MIRIDRFAHPSRTYRLFRSFGVSRTASLWRQVRVLVTGNSGRQHIPAPRVLDMGAVRMTLE